MELQINTPEYSLSRPHEWGTCCNILVTQNQQSSLGTYKGKELGFTSKEYIYANWHNLEPYDYNGL